MRIRHPEKCGLAAYLTILSVLAMLATVHFSMPLLWSRFDLASAPESPLPTMLPQHLLATWFTRKSPWRKGPSP